LEELVIWFFQMFNVAECMEKGSAEVKIAGHV